MDENGASGNGNYIVQMPALLTNHSALLNATDYWYNESDYYVYTPSAHDILLSNIQRQTAIFGIVLTIATFIINVIIVKACLRNASTRTDAFYTQIANFSVSNLLVSVFVLPCTVYYILHPWELGQTLCKIWIVFDIMIPFASMTILLILNIDRILAMSHHGAYNHLFQKCSSHITFTPWIVALVIVVPLWSLGTISYQDIPGECIVIMNTEAALLCHILTFFVPLILLVVLTLQILVLRLKNMVVMHKSQSAEQLNMQNTCVNTAPEEGYGHNDVVQVRVTSHRHNPVPHCTIGSVCAVNFLFAGMWFPFQCFSIMLTTCDSARCIPSMATNQAVTWMGTASAAIVPLFWIIDDKIRQNIKAMFVCMVRRPDRKNESTSEETFL